VVETIGKFEVVGGEMNNLYKFEGV